MDLDNLQCGDVLLYKGNGIFSWLIRIKTWHAISHVEVYFGGGFSVASRDGQGVDMYPLRTKGLVKVLRPKVPFRCTDAMTMFFTVRGARYGWLDLLHFVGLKVNGPGMVCSPFATRFLRAGGVQVFNDEPAEMIAPFQFVTSETLAPVQ